MIVDPWGEILARAPDEEAFIAADLDLARQDEVRDEAAEPRQPDARRLRVAPGGARLMASTGRAAGTSTSGG